MQKAIHSIRRKLVLSILLIAFAVLGLFVFTACSDDLTEETYRQRGFTVDVVYDYNGGLFNNVGSVKILVKENSKLPTPKLSGDIGIPSKAGCSFKGYYVAETDENGNVVYDDDGNISVTDKVWDFKTDAVTNKNVTLCAQWWDNYKLVLHYDKDYEKTLEIDLGRNEDGTPIAFYDKKALTVDGYTFISYNLVKGSTDAATEIDKDKLPFDFSNAAAASSDLKIDIWGDSLVGDYVLVKSINDLTRTSIGENLNYYLLNDIDMKGAVYNDEKATIKLPKAYSGSFIGNGHTISNFTLDLKSLDRTYANFGLFRSLSENAVVTDVTFKDVKLSYDLSDTSINSYNIGMLAGEISSGAKVENVKFVSSEQPEGKNCSVFEYLIGVGVDKTKLNIANDLLVAQKPDSVELKGCAATDVKCIASTSVVTSNGGFILYVKYTEDNGSVVLYDDSIYALAEKRSDGSYTSRRLSKIEYQGDNKYVVTRVDRVVYDVTIAYDNGAFSATLVKR